MKTQNYLPKEGSILYGKDLEEPLTTAISSVGTKRFGEGDDEREALCLHVNVRGKDMEFALGARTVAYLTAELGDETDAWIGKTVILSPVQSQTPDGKPTVSIGVVVKKNKKQ